MAYAGIGKHNMMYSQNDTMNSTQNSTINITQLMATSTSANRRSRFRNHPSAASPAPEDEDIYVSLQVLQAQLNTHAAPAASQELLERVLNKVDRLQSTVNNFSENYDFVKRQNDAALLERQKAEHEAMIVALAEKDAQINAAQKRHEAEQHALRQMFAAKEAQVNAAKNKHTIEQQQLRNTIAEKEDQLGAVQSQHAVVQHDFAALQDEVRAVKERPVGANQEDVNELRRQLADVYIKVERFEETQQQIKTMQAKIEQHDAMQVAIQELQSKVIILEAGQQQRIEIENRYNEQQNENEQLLKRIWTLEVENNKLKEVMVREGRGKKSIRPARIPKGKDFTGLSQFMTRKAEAPAVVDIEKEDTSEHTHSTNREEETDFAQFLKETEELDLDPFMKEAADSFLAENEFVENGLAENDTMLRPLDEDLVSQLRSVLEKEQSEKTGHAARPENNERRRP